MYPVHVSKHRRDRVMICEYQRQPRDRARPDRQGPLGEAASTARSSPPSACPTATPFIVTRNQILELDAKGAEVVSIPRPAYDCLSAKKMKDGKIHMVSSQGFFVKLDAAGKEISRFSIGRQRPAGLQRPLPAQGRGGRPRLQRQQGPRVRRLRQDDLGGRCPDPRLRRPPGQRQHPGGHSRRATTSSRSTRPARRSSATTSRAPRSSSIGASPCGPLRSDSEPE